MSPLLHIFYFLFFSSFLILYFQTSAADSHESCRNSCGSEGGPEVRFPFGFNATFGSLCSYPGFTLSCSKGGLTTLNLPGSGDYTVEKIDYPTQSISIRDPRNCLPKRFLESFSLSESPFVPEHDRYFTFLNCSKTNSIDVTGPTVRRVACLSNDNFTVIALTPDVYDENTTAASNCTLISKAVSVPVSWPRRSDSETRLLWDMPDCRDCERRGGTCGIYGGSVELVGCSNAPYNGLPRSAKYGIIIGVGIPGLLCLIGLVCYLGGRLRAYRHGNSQPSTAISSSIAPPHSIVVSGLDGPTIESYPKTLLGESRRLPKPNDNTCPICLSEYQPKEALRTIPECNHYFHADCIDEWLKMNATCPLCRNSPDSSCVVTPSSSVSVSSSSLSTP